MASSSSAPPSPFAEPDGICRLDATELAGLIRRRDLSCREVVSAFLDRIDAINPAVNAIVSLRNRDDIVAEADAADRRLAGVDEVIVGLAGAPESWR